jgi:hypothetical protein
MINNAQNALTKTIALFLALGMVSSLTGCELDDTDADKDKASTQQAVPESQDEGGEGGEGG